MTQAEGRDLGAFAGRSGPTRDLDATLDAVMRMLCDSVAAERGSLMLETSPGTLRIRAARGIAPHVIASSAVRVGDGIAGRVAATGVPELVHDAVRHQLRPPVLHYHCDSALCVPLLHRDRVIGVVNLSNKRHGPGATDAEFDEHDLQLAASLAKQAALVIANAEAAAAVEVRDRLERSLAAAPHAGGRDGATLAVMGLVTDSLVAAGPLDQVLSAIVRHATALLGASRGSLMLRVPGTRELQIAAAVNVPAQVVSDARARLGEGIAGLCAERGEPLLIPDVRELGISRDHDYASQYQTQSAICVPLRFRGEVLGVLSLNDRIDGMDFTPEDLFVTEIIANQASIAIWTSRMLAESVEAAATRRSLEVARQIQQSFLPEDLERPAVALSTLCISADAAGGDYVDYWLKRDAADRETGEVLFAIGDATGHGIGSALVSTTCRAFLRALLIEGGSLAGVMRQLDRLLGRDLRRGHFVTLFLGLVDPAGGRLVYASAGHPPGLLLRPSEGIHAELPATGPPLGLRLDAAFPTREIVLRPGDTVAVVTDGVFDAQNPARESFGLERLGETLASLAGTEPRAMIAGLQRRVATFAHPVAPADDVSAVVVQVRASRRGGGAAG